MNIPFQGQDGEAGTAIVLHPVLPVSASTVTGHRAVEDVLDEASGLARAIWLDVIDCRAIKVTRPMPGTLFGKGNVELVAKLVEELQPTIVIVDHPLTPVQQRNLEKEWNAKVLDRTGLILEIFGARAQTSEGKIQVELAALEYQQSRLVRSWTHLERQRGGAGFMGGPGETQIEMDRRMIRDKITRLKRELEQVRKTRDLQRRGRAKTPFPIIALVGYTNAGKSTLFNRMTGSTVFAKDLLFATLDPTMRQLKLPNAQDIILADTVGFISNLPTHLVAAFRATLEQVKFADVILHVRDISIHDSNAQRQDVITVLNDLGIDYETDPRIIEALNKVDVLPAEMQADIYREAKFESNKIAVSALTGVGIENVLAKIVELLSQNRLVITYSIPPSDGESLAWLYNRTHVLKRADRENSILMTVELDAADRGRFEDRYHHTAQKIEVVQS